MNYDKIPSELKSLKQWVCAWNTSKVPMQSKRKLAASSTNPETWSTFEDAVSSIDTGHYDHIGFVFNDNGIVGIDIDKGFDESGLLSKLSIDCMRACQSYTEKSKSGRGIHILVKGTLPFKGKNNREGVEIYQASRYFIMTGKKLVYDNIIENQDAIDYIIRKYFTETEKVSGNNRTPRIYSPIYPAPDGDTIFLRPYYPPILQGGRNLSLTSLAGQMHTQGYAPIDIYNELLVANEQACDPPLPVRELENIVSSIIRYRRD